LLCVRVSEKLFIPSAKFDLKVKYLSTVFSEQRPGLVETFIGDNVAGAFQVMGKGIVGFQYLAGLVVSYCSVTRIQEDEILITTDFVSEQCASYTAGIILAFFSGRASVMDVDHEVQNIKNILSHTEPGNLALLLLNEAVIREIPIMQLDNSSSFQLGYGSYQQRIHRTSTWFTSGLGIKIASDKHRTKTILSGIGLPAPLGVVVANRDQLVSAANEIGFPLVVKPLSGNNGRGVCVNITDWEELEIAFAKAVAISKLKGVVVERYITGADFRFLVIDYKLVAVARRTPAMVTGDGLSTILQLVNQVNEDPNRGKGHEKPLTKILIDEVTQQILKEKSFTLDTILKNGEELYLKKVANLSAGGTSEDVTDIVHAQNKMIAERIAAIFKIDICGIDIISPDITLPLPSNGGAIVEVNSGPGLRLHLEPYIGKRREVDAAILDMLFPVPGKRPIPITAHIGKPAIQMVPVLEAILAKTGTRCSLATHETSRIAGTAISMRNGTLYDWSRMILSDSFTEHALLECGLEDIKQKGLAFEYCDLLLMSLPETDPVNPNELQALYEMFGSMLTNNGRIIVSGILPDDCCLPPNQTIICNAVSAGFPIAQWLALGYEVVQLEDDMVCHYKDGAKIVLSDVSSLKDKFPGQTIFFTLLFAMNYDIPFEVATEMLLLSL
jgi:cyanophycin synthetase